MQSDIFTHLRWSITYCVRKSVIETSSFEAERKNRTIAKGEYRSTKRSPFSIPSLTTTFHLLACGNRSNDTVDRRLVLIKSEIYIQPCDYELGGHRHRRLRQYNERRQRDEFESDVIRALNSYIIVLTFNVSPFTGHLNETAVDERRSIARAVTPLKFNKNGFPVVFICIKKLNDSM